MYYCFGCGEGGDVITFVQKTGQLSFNEAVEQLAKRARIDLRYAEGGYTQRTETSERTRLLAANKAAADYYMEQLRTPAAQHGRELLLGRGFDQGAIEKFQVGYAPAGWDSLVRHLRARGFTDRELQTAGLSSDGRRGPIDRFRDRLTWPIIEPGGEVIGFGARRLSEDKDSPKYLNTPETPLYKKSSVLYGLDLARKEIAKAQRAVVVEGYTDVMACHLAGETTAIATCGTAFGEEHIKILRRLLGDRNQYLGCEVVFTFDGDSAGQKAALRAFLEDQRFVTQTFVAVQPDGLDPCELRMAHGDAAVRELVAARAPLFEFVIKARLGEYDVATAEGRVRALRATAPLVAAIRDQALRPEYGRRLAGWLGMEESVIAAEVRRAGGSVRPAYTAPPSQGGPGGSGGSGYGGSNHGGSGRGEGRFGSGERGGGDRFRRGERDGRDGAATGPYRSSLPSAPTFGPPAPAPPAALSPTQRQREALKLALQYPKLAGSLFDSLDPEEFTNPALAAVKQAIVLAGGAAGAAGDHDTWLEWIAAAVPDDRVRSFVIQLTVEPVWVKPDAKGRHVVDAHYVTSVLTKVRIDTVDRRLEALQVRLRQLDPVRQADEARTVSVERQELVRYRMSLNVSLES